VLYLRLEYSVVVNSPDPNFYFVISLISLQVNREMLNFITKFGKKPEEEKSEESNEEDNDESLHNATELSKPSDSGVVLEEIKDSDLNQQHKRRK